MLSVLLFINSCIINKDTYKNSKININGNSKIIDDPKLKNKFLKKNNKTSNAKLYTLDFIEWKCRKYFGLNNILKIGYFPETLKNGVSLGALILETNKKINPAFHSIEGIDDTFNWGGNELINYKLIIKSNNTAYFFDFKNSKKKIVDYKYMLKCTKKTFDLTKDEIGNYFKSFIKYSKKFNLDIPNIN